MFHDMRSVVGVLTDAMHVRMQSYVYCDRKYVYPYSRAPRMLSPEDSSRMEARSYRTLLRCEDIYAFTCTEFLSLSILGCV